MVLAHPPPFGFFGFTSIQDSRRDTLFSAPWFDLFGFTSIQDSRRVTLFLLMLLDSRSIRLLIYILFRKFFMMAIWYATTKCKKPSN
jgi:hypothetical protein